jgi:hypothetical protein
MANAKRDQNKIPTLIGVSSSDGITPTLAYVDPVTHRLYVDSVGGGSGFTNLPATGTVNGSNVTFTFTQVPTYIVSDGVWLTALDNNGGTQWNNVGTTITMSIPPTNSIFGVA